MTGPFPPVEPVHVPDVTSRLKATISRAARLRRRRRILAAIFAAATVLAVVLPLTVFGGGVRPATLRVIGPPNSSGLNPSPGVPATSTTTTPPTSTVPDPSTFSWTEHPGPALGNGFGDDLSCPSVNFCVAIATISGTYPQSARIGLTEFDGTSWGKVTAEPAFNDSEAALSCASSTFCLAVSGNGQYTTWNGSTWGTPASTPLGKTYATIVSCPTSVFCMLLNGTETGANGAATTIYTTWRAGQGWSAIKTLTGIVASSVSCLGDTFCMATGQATGPNGSGGQYGVDVALRWNGQTWEQPMTVENPNAIPPIGATAIDIGLGDVSCATPEFCMVVGGFHATGDMFAVWNGTNWSQETPDPVGTGVRGTGVGAVGFASVSCPTISVCLATDSGSGINGSPSTDKPPVVSVWNAGEWSVTPTSDLGKLTEISCPSIDFCVIVSSGRYWIGHPSGSIPCDAAQLFAAAVAKEGFNPKDPSYGQPGVGPAQASNLACVGPWALADVFRPRVGPTDGTTLFVYRNRAWLEIGVTGVPLTAPSLEHMGVPDGAAAALIAQQSRSG